MGDKHNCTVVWTFFGIALLWDWNENWPFLFLWPLQSFPNFLTYLVQHLIASLNSSPFALFIVMLPKAHLTSHSRVSSSRWMTIPPWLSGSLRPILYSSSVYSCHLFLISSVSFRSLPFLSFIMPILAWHIPLISPIFLKRSVVFPILLFSSVSLHCSFKKAFLFLLAILWNSAFSWVYLSLSPLPFALFFTQLFVKPSQTITLPSGISFSLGWFWSLPGLGRSPGVGNGNSLLYSCLENSMDRGVWWATVHGVSKHLAQLSH